MQRWGKESSGQRKPRLPGGESLFHCPHSVSTKGFHGFMYNFTNFLPKFGILVSKFLQSFGQMGEQPKQWDFPYSKKRVFIFSLKMLYCFMDTEAIFIV